MRIPANLRLWFVFCACLTPFSLQAGAGLSFEANLWQTSADIRYLARTLNGAMQSPGPGANLCPNVLALTTSTLQLLVQLQAVTGASAGLNPVGVGTAVVTLGNLAGDPTPANRNQLVFNVSQP
jgi:hypothetical protein